MDWLIFGDDFGVHPSTIQHLARNLPIHDRILWINSIGMRTPRLCWQDASRMLRKGMASFRGCINPLAQKTISIPPNFQVIHPMVLPWHTHGLAQRINRRSLHKAIRAAASQIGCSNLVVLAANPVAAFYLEGLPTFPIVYLRQDDYPRLPGVNYRLAEQAEKAMYQVAHRVLGTGKNLLPSKEETHAHLTYLPQGVDREHFAEVPPLPAKSKILGFYGLLAEWMDFSLISQVADLVPDWTLELVGPLRFVPPGFPNRKNIRMLPKIDYEKLPELVQRWDAAWIPFLVNELTEGVNPLKLREYLAAGLPTLSTPLPEVTGFGPWVSIAQEPSGVKSWLRQTVSSDDAHQREQRKASVANDSWTVRAQQLRDLAENTHPIHVETDSISHLGFQQQIPLDDASHGRPIHDKSSQLTSGGSQ